MVEKGERLTIKILCSRQKYPCHVQSFGWRCIGNGQAKAAGTNFSVRLVLYTARSVHLNRRPKSCTAIKFQSSVYMRNIFFGFYYFLHPLYSMFKDAGRVSSLHSFMSFLGKTHLRRVKCKSKLWRQFRYVGLVFCDVFFYLIAICVR